MFFLQATQAPVTVRLGNLKFIVPKFSMQDLVDWAAEMANLKNEAAMEGMEGSARAQYMAFYAQISVDFEEAKRLVRTPPGVEKVIRTCFSRAEVFRVLPQKGKGPEKTEKLPSLEEKHISGMIEVNGIGRLSGLALVLADLDEKAVLVDPGEKNSDPLAILASAGSPKSAETGPERSQSSRPRIKVKTGEE